MEILKILENIADFLSRSFWFQAFKFVLGLYLIIMLTTMVLILFRLVKKYSYLKLLLVGQEFEDIKPEPFQSRWNRVVNLMEEEDENSWKAAILESSVMLDEVLGIIKYKGETLGMKLAEMTPQQLENLEAVKKANDVKNEIVKNSEFEINKEEAEKLVETFGDALRFFEAIN